MNSESQARRIDVLLVEDNPGDAHLTRELLRDASGTAFAVHCAGRLATALDLIRATAPDVILLDLGLPDSQGAETFATMFAHAPGIPIIVLTGLADESMAVATVRDGAQDYLIKGQSDGTLLARSIRYAIERKRAEEGLRSSEGRFRRLFESNAIGVIVADMHGAITDSNDAFLTMVGYTRDDLAAGRVRWKAMTPPEYAESDRRGLEQLRRSGVTTPHEKEYIRSDGRRIPVHLGAALLPGTPETCICYVVDLTENKRAEHRIRWLTKAVEQSPAAVLITDTAGTIEYVNQRFTDVTGYTAGEVLGLTPRVLRSGRTAPEVYQQLWSTIASGAEWRGELENRKKSGELYWDDASISPIRNSTGRITHFLAVQQDVTARKHAETEIKSLNEHLEQRVLERTSQLAAANTKLRRHRRELQEYIDAMSTMNAKVDVDGRLLLVNRIAQQASGLPLETLLGSSFLDGAWWAFDLDVQTRVRSAFWQAVAGTPVSYEEKLFVFDRVATINLTLVPVEGADGDVAYIVAEGRDISRRIEVEEALKAANHELEAFTYSVSHDLRAPIRHIDGFSRLLEEHLDGMLDDRARRYLSRVREATHHMGRLVDDLLRLAQVGRQDIRPRTTSLATLLSEVLADLHGDLVGRDVQWKLGHLPTIDCDPGLMKVVLTNLVANAVKYTRPRHPAVIEIGHQSRNGRQVIFVRDNGVGFDTKYADRLFGAFQRLHRAEDFEGTGIGLATVQRIVHKHGGEIWAEAEPDKGATFLFTLGSALGTAAGAR